MIPTLKFKPTPTFLLYTVKPRRKPFPIRPPRKVRPVMTASIVHESYFPFILYGGIITVAVLGILGCFVMPRVCKTVQTRLESHDSESALKSEDCCHRPRGAFPRVHASGLERAVPSIWSADSNDGCAERQAGDPILRPSSGAIQTTDIPEEEAENPFEVPHLNNASVAAEASSLGHTHPVSSDGQPCNPFVNGRTAPELSPPLTSVTPVVPILAATRSQRQSHRTLSSRTVISTLCKEPATHAGPAAPVQAATSLGSDDEMQTQMASLMSELNDVWAAIGRLRQAHLESTVANSNSQPGDLRSQFSSVLPDYRDDYSARTRGGSTSGSEHGDHRRGGRAVNSAEGEL